MTEALDEIDDPALVMALRARDTAAMRTLYSRFSERIFRFLCRMTGNHAIADDLHQETWLAAASHVATLRADSDLAAWLFTIARNKHRSWRRWSVLGDRFATSWNDGAAESNTGRPSDAKDGLHDLEKSLGRLPPPLREVLLLVGCEQLDAAQAAEVLGVTAEAVRQRVSRARSALRELMSEGDDLAAARARRRGAR